MKKYKILIVEDEVIVALDIKDELEILGYEVIDLVTNHTNALKTVQNELPDLIIMDINLKNSKDGIETAKAILQIQYIPIIYLTAYTDDITIEKASNTNPVGYITKPFKNDDLRISLRLAFSKLSIKTKDIKIKERLLHIGLDYYINLDNYNVYYKNILLKLSKNEICLLKLLVSARGNIVTFNQIEYEVWPDYPVSNNSLRNLVHRLRCKFDYKLIKNVHGIGFNL